MYVGLSSYYYYDLLLALLGDNLHAGKDRYLQGFVLFYCMQVSYI